LGVELIEWTYDPLQAPNAHLNFAKLGVVVEEYEENVYGDSASPLHRGNPTDRFIAEWWIRTPHVERRLTAASPIVLRANELAEVPSVNQPAGSGQWPACGRVDLGIDARRVAVQIPT